MNLAHFGITWSWLHLLRAFSSYLILLVVAVGLSSECVAGSAGGQEDISPDTVVLLLSQKTHSTTEDVLNDHLMKWRKSDLSVGIVSAGSVEPVLNLIANFQKVLKDAGVNVALHYEVDIDNADFVLSFDEKASDIMKIHNLNVEHLLSTKSLRANHEVAMQFTDIANQDGGDCLGIDSEYQDEKVKSVLFVSSAQSQHDQEKCASSLFLTSLGLSNIAIQGNSVVRHDNALNEPTASDLYALKLLYGLNVKPGDTIGDVLATQSQLKFSPHI